MTTKDYLSQGFGLENSIILKQQRIKQLRSIRINMGVTVNKASKARLVDRLENEEIDCHAEIARLLDIQSEIASLINSVTHPAQRLILHERYVNLKGWSEIAIACHYSLKWVHVLHNRGVDFLGHLS